MKGFNLRTVDQTKLSATGREFYNKIDALQIKRATQGGLEYLDQFQLGDAIKKLNEELTTPVEVMSVNVEEAEVKVDVQAQADEDLTRKAIKGLVEEFKKLPMDVRPKGEQWTENPRYAAYMKSLPESEQPRKITVSLDRAQKIKK